jgi:Fur family ferric uptake transcriptional regulator
MVKIDVWQAVLRILDSYLEVNNHRKTPERYTILKAIYKTEGHFTLYELSERLIRDYKFPVSRATLYNTMKLFLQLRLVVKHRFQDITVYEASYDNMSHSHQICTVCGKVTEVKTPKISDAIDETHLRRFRKDGYTLYIYGVCSTCQAKLTKMRNKELKRKQTTDKK